MVDQSTLSDNGWSFVELSLQKVIDKVYSRSEPLSKYVDGKLFRGLLTGLNDAFIIDQSNQRSAYSRGCEK